MFRIVHVVRRNLNEYIVCVLSVDIENMREERESSNEYNMMYDDETGWLSHWHSTALVCKTTRPIDPAGSAQRNILFYFLFIFVCF